MKKSGKILAIIIPIVLITTIVGATNMIDVTQTLSNETTLVTPEEVQENATGQETGSQESETPETTTTTGDASQESSTQTETTQTSTESNQQTTNNERNPYVYEDGNRRYSPSCVIINHDDDPKIPLN
jgi:cytoskeletal protein RodZ